MTPRFTLLKALFSLLRDLFDLLLSPSILFYDTYIHTPTFISSQTLTDPRYLMPFCNFFLAISHYHLHMSIWGRGLRFYYVAIGHFILSLSSLPFCFFFTIIFSVLWSGGGGHKGLRSRRDGGGGVHREVGEQRLISNGKGILMTKVFAFFIRSIFQFFNFFCLFVCLFIYLFVWHHNLFLAREQGLGRGRYLFFFFLIHFPKLREDWVGGALDI